MSESKPLPRSVKILIAVVLILALVFLAILIGIKTGYIPRPYNDIADLS